MAEHYSASHKMSDLATNNYRMLLVMSRFGIGLGFGEKSIAQVCDDHGVDIDTFLAVINMLVDDGHVTDSMVNQVNPQALMDFLKRSHDYFLQYRLPGIRKDLVEVLDKSQNSLNEAVLKYFDEYAGEVNKHMKYEERKVFPYVAALVSGRYEGKYSIDIFRRHHDQIELKLTEFKQILIKYYPASGTNELNNVLFDIFNCENDLANHSKIEDNLFIPAIVKLESSIA